MPVLSKRVHPKDLASVEEIRNMMVIEAKRVPSSAQHFPDFSSAQEWIRKLNIQSGIFTDPQTLEGVAEQADKVKPLVVKRTLEMKPYKELKMVEEYLGEEDKLEKVDITVVFGGKTLSRADKGAEIYLGGWTSRLLMTGKGPIYGGKFTKPEAEVFKDRAAELGVPESKIITECESINIPDNVKASLNLLDKMGFKYRSLMQIISWYAQRRTWVTLKKYVDSRVKLVRVNANLPKNNGKPNDYEKGIWYKTGEGIEIVFNEFIKMRFQEVTDSA